MSYLDLVPSEDSTGSSRRQGAITQTGSGHGRRPWSKRRGTTAARPATAPYASADRSGNPPGHRARWHAQRRLHRTWQRLDAERGKRRTIIAVAVARELAGFCWAAANAVDKPAPRSVIWEASGDGEAVVKSIGD